MNLALGDGLTALALACIKGQPEIVSRLLAHPGLTCLNALATGGFTPLMLAVSYGSLDCVRELVEQPGVELEARDEDGKSLEDMARGRGYPEAWEIVREELERRQQE